MPPAGHRIGRPGKARLRARRLRPPGWSTTATACCRPTVAGWRSSPTPGRHAGVDLRDGSERQFDDGKPAAYWGQGPTWSPDGRWLFWTGGVPRLRMAGWLGGGADGRRRRPARAGRPGGRAQGAVTRTGQRGPGRQVSVGVVRQRLLDGHVEHAGLAGHRLEPRRPPAGAHRDRPAPGPRAGWPGGRTRWRSRAGGRRATARAAPTGRVRRPRRGRRSVEHGCRRRPDATAGEPGPVAQDRAPHQAGPGAGDQQGDVGTEPAARARWTARGGPARRRRRPSAPRPCSRRPRARSSGRDR